MKVDLWEAVFWLGLVTFLVGLATIEWAYLAVGFGLFIMAAAVYKIWNR